MILFDIGDRARKVSRFIAHVRSELQRALMEEKATRKVTQQSIAEKLGVNRSVVNRQFKGEENLTLRSVGDLAWALGWELDFHLRKSEAREGDNFAPYLRRHEVLHNQTSNSSPTQIVDSTVPISLAGSSARVEIIQIPEAA